ncbi:MDR family MFS transporter [Mycobacterium intracellulare]|uniref:Major Facilitator Superfamily transporter n=2 Tax=Mycobacterium intracellulare TaxID=1767 RepID=A0A7U5MIY1_MYCIT|nr:Major Facilitator Superfamily transporter [Mycobacterium intracellulare subsp. chimaera]
MKTLIAQFRSFDRPARMLMINQFGINLGFYMLMPYLAAYLAGPLGLAAWAIGLVLGVRNFSQQGMFVVGGTLADRVGYKPLIVAGCLLRTGGFALLVVAHSLPAVLIASAATGFAGALFNPAVRAYLAADSGDRRVEAFAVFNVFYQAGILLGPLVGVVLVAVDFRVTAASAAAVFAVLTVAQLLALPEHSADSTPQKTSVLDDWRVVLGNRSFLLFAAAMIGSYVLSFQVYLALPLQASLLTKRYQSLLVAGVFVVSGLVAVAGQLRITGWFAARWGRGRSVAIGVAILASSFVPLTLIPDIDRYGAVAAVAALLVSAAMLAVGSAAVFPFEMDTVIALAGGRLVATHYGFYNTIVGVGILAGNLATGWLMGAARQLGVDELVWAGLVLLGIIASWAVHRLDRARHLEAKPAAQTSAGATGPRASHGSEPKPDPRDLPPPMVTRRGTHRSHTVGAVGGLGSAHGDERDAICPLLSEDTRKRELHGQLV